MIRKSVFRTTLTAVAATLLLTGTASNARAEQLVGFTNLGPFQFLVGLDSDRPLFPNRAAFIFGLQNGEQLIALDVRPATGELFGVATRPGNNNVTTRLYKINPNNGFATPVGGPIEPTIAKDGRTSFGFDFNPTIDRARLISTQDENFVFNPNDGSASVQTNLFYIPLDVNEGKNPNIISIAYDNNVDDAVVSVQRGIDSNTDDLVIVGNNTGALTTVGPLGIDVKDLGGFDVTADGTAFAVLTPQSTIFQFLYEIDLQSGTANELSLAALGIFRLRGLTALP